MSSSQPDVPVSTFVTYGAAYLVAAVFLAKLAQPSKLAAIPTVGSSGWFSSLWAGFKFLTVDGISIVREGYKKYKSAPFKIADRYGWVVVVSRREHIEELRRAPDDELSFVESIDNQFSIRYTMENQIDDSCDHATVIRSHLNRDLGMLYPDVRDEIIAAFEEVLDCKGSEWKGVFALGAVQKIVCRANNRLFVGLPLCRDARWISLCIQNAKNIIKMGFFLGLFPEFAKPLAIYLFAAVAQDIKLSEKYLGPTIEERLRRLKECDDNGAEKHNDLLWWFMEEAKGPQLTVKRLTSALLFTNFASLHTPAVSFTHALFYLAVNPQYIQPLREEVDAIIEKDGWSKISVAKMHKIDSFLRECQRIEGVGALSIRRKAMKDFTFSDGTFIPRGTIVATATDCIHHDERFYANPTVFEPFRFAEMQGSEDDEGGKYRFTSTSTEYLPFGHGRHACPGRFYVAAMMKTILVHVVARYDVRLEDGAPPPRSWRFGYANAPDPHAKVLFRRRVD